MVYPETLRSGVKLEKRSSCGEQPRGIRWTLFSSLEDLGFADDLTLLPYTHQHMQDKTTRIIIFAHQVGLKISHKKPEVMTLNIPNPSPIQVDGADLPTTESFTYLGSAVRHDGEAGSNIKSHLSKARNTFKMLNNIWRSSQYSATTKLRFTRAVSSPHYSMAQNAGG
ncbi:uncharacterized protein [Littorina saxatilis]|uniref:uncharacterized protein n=1 Tax=Littorina saxatilis TaxID=31220 RepID=UPI0038B4D795